MGNIPKTMENHPVLWVNQRMGKLKLDFREYINGFWKNQQETCRVLPGREGWSYVIPKRQLSILPATSVGNNYAYESMPTMAIDVLLKWQICKNFPEKVVRWQSKPSSDINLGVIFTGHRHQNPPKTSNICDICDGKRGKTHGFVNGSACPPGWSAKATGVMADWPATSMGTWRSWKEISVNMPSGNLTWLWKITIFNGKIHY